MELAQGSSPPSRRPDEPLMGTAKGHPCRPDLWILPFALLVLLPFGRLAELATFALILLCAVMLVCRPRELIRLSGVRWAMVVWGCYELAALASTMHAVMPSRTWETVAAMMRYLPLTVGIAWILREGRQWSCLSRAIAWLLLFWSLDAWMQALTGWSVRGHAEPHRLTGIFGAGDPKIGQVLATLSPFILDRARACRSGRLCAALIALLLLGPILLSGSRASWLTYALVLAVLLWREAGSFRRFALWAGVALVAGALAMGLAWRTSSRFDARMGRTLMAFQGSERGLNAALSFRLSIWGDALRMVAANPWTGVGVRGFRYAYPRFALAGDPFVKPGAREGAFYAHQIILEILSESGVVGLALWLLGISLAIRLWRRARPDARERAWPASVALLAAVFPFNTALAFYSAWWGLLFWWLLAIWIGVLSSDVRMGCHGA